MGELLIIRLLFVAVVAFAAYFLHPFNIEGPLAAGIGELNGIGVVVFEIRIKKVSLTRLIGAAFGSVL
jgi:calcineurin-like phosphoesterase